MKSYGKTDKGVVRNQNQDYIFYSDNPVGNLPNLYILADGMGGHNAGAFASSYAVNSYVSYVKNIEEVNLVNIIQKGIKFVNKLVYNKAETNKQYSKMGTTFVVATITDDFLYIGNVGDSRLYIIDSDISKITKDHSLVEEMLDIGFITEEEAKNHPKKNIITRAVGVEEEIEVDIYKISYNLGDTILMCSDGLTNMVEDETINNIIQTEKNITVLVDKLVEKANVNGGTDNISVIIIKSQE